MIHKKITIDDVIESINLYDVDSFVSIDSYKPSPKVPYQIPVIARHITNGIVEPEVKAYALYAWVKDNIKYNVVSNEKFHDKSALIYSLKNKAGTCYSMTRVYITLAKSVDLDARIAKVIVDRNGNEIGKPGHVCAMVDFVDEHLLFDPAYNDGDAKHKKIEFLSRESTNQALINDILNPYRTVYDLFESDDFKNKLDCCDMVLKLFPDNEYFRTKKQQVLNQVGLENINKGKMSNGIYCFEEILRIDPDNHIAKHNLELAKSMADSV